MENKIYLETMIYGYERFLYEESYDSHTEWETRHEIMELEAELQEVIWDLEEMGINAY